MTVGNIARIGVALLMLAGCGRQPDAAMWECQLEAQKGNAGKSAEAATERGWAIDACMEQRGYRLDFANRSCQQGSVQAGCYQPRNP